MDEREVERRLRTALELEDGSPFELSCTPDRSYVFRRM